MSQPKPNERSCDSIDEFRAKFFPRSSSQDASAKQDPYAFGAQLARDSLGEARELVTSQ